MKRIILFICIGGCVSGSCQSDPTRFVLNGTFRPDDDVKTVYLRYEKDGKQIYDTATVSGSHFRFEGNIDAPASATLFDEQQRRNFISLRQKWSLPGVWQNLTSLP